MINRLSAPCVASTSGRWNIAHAHQSLTSCTRGRSSWRGQTSSCWCQSSNIRFLQPQHHHSSCQKKMMSTAYPSLTDEEEKTIRQLADDILSIDGNKGSDKYTALSLHNISKRIALARAITLVESRSPRKRLMADILLKMLKQSESEVKNPVSYFRLGIAGPPGSCFLFSLSYRSLHFVCLMF